MFSFLRFVLWTGFALVAGVLIATVQVNGRTPLQHMQRSWGDSLKGRVDELIHGAKEALSHEEPFAPTERHSPQDREAVKKLIANRGSQK